MDIQRNSKVTRLSRFFEMIKHYRAHTPNTIVLIYHRNYAAYSAEFFTVAMKSSSFDKYESRFEAAVDAHMPSFESL